jgi:tetratricopeptide (TPR) repeat protein
VLKHHTAAFQQTNNGTFKIVYDTLTYQKELDADTYAIGQLRYLESFQIAYSWFGLNNLISFMYPWTMRDWNNHDSVKYYLRADPTIHPPWIYRFMKMAKVVFSRYPQIIDQSGYYEFLENKIVLSDTAAKQGLFCSYKKNIISFKEDDVNIDTTDLSFLYDRCRLYIVTENYDVLKTYLSRASKLMANKKKANSFWLNYNFYQGMISFRKRDYKGSLEYFKKITIDDVTFQEYDIFLQARGIAYLSLRKAREARPYFLAALERYPDNAAVWLFIGICQLLEKDKKGLQSIGLARILKPDLFDKNNLRYHAEVPENLIDSVLRWERRVPADSFFLRDTTIRNSLYRLAGYRYKNQDSKGAVRIIKALQNNECLWKVPEVSELYNFEAMCLKSDKDYIGAEQAYLKALDIRKQSSQRQNNILNRFFVGQTLYNLGNLVLVWKNDTTASINHYKAAISWYSFKQLSTDYLQEEMKAFINLSSLYNYRGCYDSSYTILCELDSLSNGNNTLKEHTVVLLFDFIKRQSVDTDSVPAYMEARMKRAIPDDTLWKEHRVFIENYFKDPVARNSTNGAWLMNLLKYSGAGDIVTLVKAFFLYNKALCACNDERLPTLVSDMYGVHHYICDRKDISLDSLYMLDTIQQKWLQVFIDKSADSGDVRHARNARAGIQGKMAFIKLSQADFIKAGELARTALTDNPDEGTAKAVLFLSDCQLKNEPDITNLTPDEKMNIGIIIARLPDGEKNKQLYKKIIEALKKTQS